MREKLCPVVKMLFHMGNCGHVGRLKAIAETLLWVLLLGARAPISLKQSSWHANTSGVNAIATFPKN